MLQERIIILKEAPAGKGPVIYWMSRDQRVDDNWALICAQELAIREKVPLIVVFCLVPRFLNATTGQYAFMLAGLKELSQRLSKLNIPFFLVTGEPDKTLIQFIKTYTASTLITDFDPLRIKRQWKEEVARKIDNSFLRGRCPQHCTLHHCFTETGIRGVYDPKKDREIITSFFRHFSEASKTSLSVDKRSAPYRMGKTSGITENRQHNGQF